MRAMCRVAFHRTSFKVSSAEGMGTPLCKIAENIMVDACGCMLSCILSDDMFYYFW